MSYIAQNVDVVVIGGGHAGCEAALASARMGKDTIMFTMNLESIAMMPCNPNIGGTSKGHLVREIDALGGEMGKNIDKTFIQSKMLNTAKGPAVHSLRAQADKYGYAKEMKKTLENTPNLKIKQAEIVKIQVEDGKIVSVVTSLGAVYPCKAAILATGTYLKARCLTGEHVQYSGPDGLKSSKVLTEVLEGLGVEIVRFKTGTPCRVDRNSIDLSKMEPQYGDDVIVPFSFESREEDIRRDQQPCYLAYTNQHTHDLISENLHRSPMYSGVIEGVGARYCPSIEDKIVRFADKDRHQIFLEPEGLHTTEMYVQGLSSSLPEEVQVSMLRTIPGMEKVEVMRTGYAIEYDCINPTQLTVSLEFKNIKGFFSAGQMNGSSGYEEAAAQGLVTGINAVNYIDNKEPMIIDRSEGYIGVLIDDLVIKGTNEPYRMMTSRAEYRLLLRQDNADLRLTPKGYKAGLISEERYKDFLQKREAIDTEMKRLKNTYISNTETVQEILQKEKSTVLKSGSSLLELLKRPEIAYETLAPVDPERPVLAPAVIEQVMIELKYEGYIYRQRQQVDQFKKLERKGIPQGIDYKEIKGLRIEAKQKLSAINPISIGQASRISGVSPADISVLLMYIEQWGARK
ncbi:MAG TPA: tRNA uridine-5-carboxymethylaminomethyl(34) synthesis enzyme MnmG [Epulopiscium sp.]|nr:tRNA uridine-5-carboxymethylaminomethyl(34) synthesis enzyme MnmG [Candidatus Epulonipiscium sp.]